MKIAPRPPNRILTAREKRLLRGRAWNGLTFRYADFSRADFRNARFDRVVFIHCSLAQVDFRGAECTDCRFVACDFGATVFGGNLFRDSVFRSSRRLPPDAVTLICSHGGRVVETPPSTRKARRPRKAGTRS